MTCGSCVAKVRSALEALPGVKAANIKLETPQAVLETDQVISPEKLQKQLYTAGNYRIEEWSHPAAVADLLPVTAETYRPLLMIISFITVVSLLAQFPFEDFSLMMWMRHFMAGFFLVFSFFKLLNLQGFSDSYRMYDLLAARWKAWAYAYPFVELALGLSYLINIAPVLTNWITVVVLGISSIGVIRSNLDKRKIKCACLGDVFNLPMSTVTIVEDVSMVIMAAAMLIWPGV